MRQNVHFWGNFFVVANTVHLIETVFTESKISAQVVSCCCDPWPPGGNVPPGGVRRTGGGGGGGDLPCVHLY